MLEKLGKSSRTVDIELELQIETLRDTQRKYLNILKLSRALASHFHHMVLTQVRLRLEIDVLFSFPWIHPPWYSLILYVTF